MTSVPHRRIICICLLLILLFLTGCGTSKAYPPSEESVRSAAEQLGWTIDPEGTQSWVEGQILYTLVSDDLPKTTISFALADGRRMVTLHSFGGKTSEKPEFAWEYWKAAISLVEDLYDGFSQGELYEYLCQQGIPAPLDLTGAINVPAGYERRRQDIDCPGGFGWASWSTQGANIEYGFGGRRIHEWSEQFTVSLYESKDFFESTRQKS